ncbi:MAG: hypothetical protein RR630_00710 [Coprobacillus sp.]
MNDLLERYLGAVCSYFNGPKRHKVYRDLKREIQSSVHQYDDLEAMLVSYGHPRCVALSYGYRPLLNHTFNPKVVVFVEKLVFIVSGIYLFFSTLYYLQQFNCLPFQTTQHVVSSIYMSTFFTWLLSNPFVIMLSISVISCIIFFLLDRKYPADLSPLEHWNIETLNSLPHQSHYPYRITETVFMVIFTLYFFIYTLFFSSDTILIIQHESYQMIHLMTYFFQPFIMIIFVDYFIDMTKKRYTKRYLKYSSLINLFTLSSLIIFIYNSDLLKDYLLPFGVSFEYTLVNIFILGAIFMISLISLYKLMRNLKSYRSLFRK